mgnify:CR=1 FL=1
MFKSHAHRTMDMTEGSLLTKVLFFSLPIMLSGILQLLLDKLAQLGYADVTVRAFPVQFGAFDLESSNWYCVLARKAK